VVYTPKKEKKHCKMPFNCGLSDAKISASVTGNEK